MRAFAYQNISEEVNRSSSGGAYRRILHTLLSLHPNKKFSYYGAAWNKDLSVSHRRVDSLDEAANLFSGSKYVRSDITGIPDCVAEDLLNGVYVVFSGTPCQVFGILAYLKNKNISTENLLTIDIICHGTPKRDILQDALNWWAKKEGSPVVAMSCRDKRVGWKDYPVSVKFQDGREWLNTYNTQLYIRLFFTHLIMYKGCYTCKFSNMDRHSDITIGDFWGVEDVFPDLNPGKGVSLMLANSDCGQLVLSEIERTLKKEESLLQCNDNSFLKYQHNLNRPTDMPSDYDAFWKDYHDKGFGYVIKKYQVNDWITFARYCKRKAIRILKGSQGK